MRVATKVFGSSSFSVLGGEADSLDKALLPQFRKSVQEIYSSATDYSCMMTTVSPSCWTNHKGDGQLEYDDKEKHIELPEIINLEILLAIWCM